MAFVLLPGFVCDLQPFFGQPIPFWTGLVSRISLLFTEGVCGKVKSGSVEALIRMD
jgi:hypothetical protein